MSVISANFTKQKIKSASKDGWEGIRSFVQVPEINLTTFRDPGKSMGLKFVKVLLPFFEFLFRMFLYFNCHVIRGVDSSNRE